MKKLIALTLSAALLAGTALAAVPQDNVPTHPKTLAVVAAETELFPKKFDYPGFPDVKNTDWFAATAKTCYEAGLLMGTNIGFEPNTRITRGSVAAIAARMNETITGSEIPAPVPDPSIPWYQRYLDYLAPLGVDVSRPTEDATRLDFLQMLAIVTSDELLTPRNTISSLPDTSDETVLKFYRAGILTGVDKYGTFAGDKDLTRAEVAAMVARIVRPQQRASFTPADYTMFTAAYLKPDDILFEKGGTKVTAVQFLPRALEKISVLEARDADLGIEFNWHHLSDDGKTYVETVRDYCLADTGLTRRDATDLYKQVFDLQVFYSRYIDLTGSHL